MRLIDADALEDKVADLYTEGEEATESDKVVNDVIDLIDNAPTVEYPEQITVECDTEEDKQKLLLALRNVKLKAIVEDERPQGDLISRSALKEHKFTTQVCNGVEIESVDVVGVATIDNALTVDTYTEDDIHYAIKEGHQVGYEMAKAKYSPKTGHWYEKRIDEQYGNPPHGFLTRYEWRCSECEDVPCYEHDIHTLNFCPNCGADMRVKDELKEAEND